MHTSNFSPVRGLALLGTIASVAFSFPTQRAISNDLPNEYDYIIVGGGLSGLVVGNRLSEDPNTSVLVIEFGDFDDTWVTAMPGHTNLGGTENLTWQFPSTPQAGMGGRVGAVTQGATVGGGTTVNGMAFDLASAADINAWEALGNEGWGWGGLESYIQKSTTFNPPLPETVEEYNFTWDETTYGDGPVQLAWSDFQWPDMVPQREGMKEMGLTVLDDHGAGGNNVGLAFIPQNSSPENVTRSGSREAYYDPIANMRPNLDLLVMHYVSGIQFDEKTAIGVVVQSRESGESTTFDARKEVIMAAGAIQTPRILQHSGVGPVSILEPLGIPVVADLPGVGRNLQDHPWTVMIASYTNPDELNPSLMSDEAFLDAAWEEYLTNRTGALTLARGSSMVFLALQHIQEDYEAVATAITEQDPQAYLPEAYSESSELLAGFLEQRAILVEQFRGDNAGLIEIPFGGGAGGALVLQKPLSRGTVSIASAEYDPSEGPIIDFGIFQNSVDLDAMVAAVKWYREWYQTDAIQSLGPVEIRPGANETSDEAIASFLVESIMPSFSHPSGTAAMASKEKGGVVGPDLKVHGLEGLRIVDASIIPMIPACHLQATMFAVAEKAADLIKGQ